MRLPGILLAATLPLFLGAAVPEGPFVVKPYLQLGHTPAPDKLALLWHAPDADTAWSVEYRIGADGAWKKADAPRASRVAVTGIAPHRVYRAALSGLEPGGTFTYRVNQGGKEVFSAEGRAPKSAGQPYRFVAFGDCGAGTTDQKPLAYRAFLAKPDFVVIPGDIVYEEGRISEYHETFWPVYNADEPSPATGVPLLRSTLFVAAPGNHDTGNRDLDKHADGLGYFLYWDQPLNGPLAKEGSAIVPPLIASEANRRAFTSAAGDAYPRMTNFSFDYGNAHWTIVDSNPYVDWTNPELLKWVERDLAAAQRATWRFVMFHHPPFNSAREHLEQQQTRALAPLFEAGNVDVVFNGHVHNYQRSFPMRFKPDNKGTLLVGGRDGKTVRGRVINGRWALDKAFDGRNDTTPDGVIYLITGAGGQKLYNPEQQDDRDSWQGFTDKFISKVHSLTIAEVDGKTLTIRQVTGDGQELDRFTVTK
ncbi:MAG: metallophosphoesterase family protein [Isosphaeraceae bacterium]|nr:metallophosphoesterase family protein [Isosphaeraceae bacterium]